MTLRVAVPRAPASLRGRNMQRINFISFPPRNPLNFLPDSILWAEVDLISSFLSQRDELRVRVSKRC